jgi:AraC-like DNA-binding protein
MEGAAANALIDRASTADFAEAEAVMSGAYCRHRLQPSDSRANLDLRYVSLALGRSRFSSLHYGCEVIVDPNLFETFYMLEMPLCGGVKLQYGGDTVSSCRGRALLISPGRRLVSRWLGGTRQLMLLIDRETVERRLAELSHRRRTVTPIFSPVIDLAAPHGRGIAAAFRLMAAALEDPTVAPPDILNSVVDYLLQNFAYEGDGSIVPERLGATPRHVKRAMDIFHEHFDERLSISGIAEEVGVSERALFHGFKRFYQRSPHEMLMRVRMEAARRLITEEGVGVAAAAVKSGVNHLGRFAAEYRKLFGCVPSADKPRRT